MKKFFIMNFLLSVTAIFVAHFAVENSFEFSLNQIKHLENKTNDLKKITHKEIEINNDVKAVAIVPIKKVLKENKVFKYKNIDFTPAGSKIKKVSIKNNNVEKKISYASFPNKKISYNTNKLKHPVKKLPIKKSKSTLKKIKSFHLELSYSDIEEQGSVDIAPVKQVAWSKIKINFPKEKLIIAKNDNKINDRISTAVAATEKSSKTKDEVIPEERDELLFFDYPKESQIKENIITQAKSEVIRETKIETPKTIDKIDPMDIQKQILSTINSTESATESNSNLSYNQAKSLLENKMVQKVSERKSAAKRSEQIAASAIPKPSSSGNALVGESDNNDYICFDKSEMNNEISQVDYKLELFSVEYSKNEYSPVRNFEARFYDNTNEIIEDFGSGHIRIKKKLNGTISTRRVGIYSRGYYPLQTDIILENAVINAKMPLFELNSFNELMQEEGVIGDGGHLLIELDNKTEDVDLDITKKYERKIYLDKYLRSVDRDLSDYHYILFLGVETGNVIAKYKNTKNEILTKIIYLEENAIYYDPNFYFNAKSELLSFYKEELLSKCKSLVNMSEENITLWSDDNYQIKEESTNSLNIKNATYLLGSRKYLTVKYSDLNEQLFVGRWSQEKVVLPTEDYINHVLSKFESDFDRNSCVVQLNFTKKIREIFFNGQSSGQAMDMEINVLDSDGQFYKDFSESSEKAFLLGQEEGAIHIKIKYADNSEQYLHSYCNSSKYIVEQL